MSSLEQKKKKRNNDVMINLLKLIIYQQLRNSDVIDLTTRLFACLLQWLKSRGQWPTAVYSIQHINYTSCEIFPAGLRTVRFLKGHMENTKWKKILLLKKCFQEQAERLKSIFFLFGFIVISFSFPETVKKQHLKVGLMVCPNIYPQIIVRRSGGMFYLCISRVLWAEVKTKTDLSHFILCVKKYSW